MDTEKLKQIADYFDAWDLVELLRLDTMDIVMYFEDEIEDAIDDINELMGVTNDEERL